MADEQTLGDFCVGEGGPLRRLEIAAHLTSLRRQVTVVLVVTWVPVMVLGVLRETLTGQREPLLHDASLHVRLLIAAPLFLFLDQVFPPGCRRLLGQLVAQAFVPDSVRPRFDRVVRSANRLADSPLPELFLVLLSIGIGIATLIGVVPVSGLAHRPATGLTPAQIWYALTDWPLFQFLLWRSLWRWVVWVRILVGLARIPLDLVPSHPDRRGGIAFLRLPSIGYCATLLFAVSSVLCAEWRTKFAAGATLGAFKPLLVLFGVIGALVALGPLLLFVPRLATARRVGLEEFTGLAADYCRRFRHKWIVGRPVDENFLGMLDTGPLAELATVYRDPIDHLNLLLFYKRDVVILLAATLLPILPVMLASIPGEDWREVLGLLTGGWLR